MSEPTPAQEVAGARQRVGVQDNASSEAIMSTQPPASQNTDRELWREVPDDYYSPSIHVTQDGKIGINVGGKVVVRDVRDIHKAIADPASASPADEQERLRLFERYNSGELTFAAALSSYAEAQVAKERAALTGQPDLVDWRACPRCGKSWPHPGVTSGRPCPSCHAQTQVERAVREERDACAKRVDFWASQAAIHGTVKEVTLCENIAADLRKRGESGGQK